MRRICPRDRERRWSRSSLLLFIEQLPLLLGLRELGLGGVRRSPETFATDLHLVERAVQRLRRSLRGLEDLPERDLELRELGVHVILRLGTHDASPLLTLGNDAVGFRRGPGHDLLLAGHPELLLVRLLDDPLAFLASLPEQLLPIPPDPSRAFELLGQ